MKKAVIISSAAVLLLLAATAAFGLYWERKLQPIIDTPAARLTASPYRLVSLPKTKALNLGYERVLVPESIEGELVSAGSNVIMLKGEKAAIPAICFMPPMDRRDPGQLALRNSITRLTDVPVNSWFDFQKLLLAQKPASVWQLAMMGKRASRARVALLALKNLIYSGQTAVRLFENERVGVIVRNLDSGTMVTLEDLRSGWSQDVLIGESGKNIDEVISALASDYELKPPAADDATIGRLISDAGLKTEAVKPTSTDDERQRFETAKQEIERRRLLHKQPSHP